MTPWGVSTLAGSKGEKSVLPMEAEVAEYQGKVRALTSIQFRNTDGRTNFSTLPTLLAPT